MSTHACILVLHGFTHKHSLVLSSQSRIVAVTKSKNVVLGLFLGQRGCMVCLHYYIFTFDNISFDCLESKMIGILQHLPSQNVSSPSSTSSLDHPHPPSQKAHASPCCRLKIKQLSGTVAELPSDWLYLFTNRLHIN